MKKLIAGGVAALAIAAAVPLVATAGHGDRDRGGHGMRGEHHGEHGIRGGHNDGHRGEHGMRGDRGAGGGGHHARIGMTETIETYDADGDGSVTQAEVDAWRASRLSKFDTDGNGQLSLEEYQVLWLDAMHEHMVDQFQAHDDNGDGVVTVDEFGERTSRLVMMRDRNDDGVLNLDDTRRSRRGDGPHMMREAGGMPGGMTPGAISPGGANPGAAGTAGASDAQQAPGAEAEPTVPAQQ